MYYFTSNEWIHKTFWKRWKKNVFFVKDDSILDKYSKIWDKIKKKLKIKFHSKPVYNQRYLKAKVREFDGVIKTNFLGNEVPKQICIILALLALLLILLCNGKKIIHKFI